MSQNFGRPRTSRLVVNSRGTTSPFAVEHIVGSEVIRGVPPDRAVNRATTVRDIVERLDVNPVSTDTIRLLLDDLRAVGPQDPVPVSLLVNVLERARTVGLQPLGPIAETRLLPEAGLQFVALARSIDGDLPPRQAGTPNYYPPNWVQLTKALHDGSRWRFEFVTLPENFYYCPGVDFTLADGELTLFFARMHVGVKATPNAPAFPLPGDPFAQGAFVDAPSDVPIFISNSDSKRDFRGDEPVRDEDIIEANPGVATTCGNFILSIHSNVREDGPEDLGLVSGHAWLSLSNCATGNLIATYGLWPDEHPAIQKAGLANGEGSDVRVNFAGDRKNQTLRHYFCSLCISDEQKAIFDAEVAETLNWGYFDNCASFASDVFEEVTGKDIDADDVAGIDTPREVGESIFEENGNQRTPPPGQPPIAPGSSSSFD